MHIHDYKKRQTGALLSFVAATSLVVVAVGLAVICMLYIVCGNREGSHAHDGGTLNVAKKSVLVNVAGTAQENTYYNATSDKNNPGHYSLKSINQMWARCLIIMVNSWSMHLTGTETPQSISNSNTAWALANSISNKLSAKLNSKANLYGYFDDITQSNSLRMFSADGKMEKSGKWDTTCLNRGSESNILFNSQFIPFPLSKPSLTGDPTIVVNGSEYMRGYTPLHVGNGRFINFVSFENKQQPHLVSQVTFAGMKKTKMQWQRPVPNTFLCSSSAGNQFKQDHKWSAAGIANTMSTDKLDMPNGFIHIKLSVDQWKWYPNYQSAGNDVSLPKGPSSPSASLHDSFWSGMYTANGECGDQYLGGNGPTLYQAIYSYNGENNDVYGQMKGLLISRINQIKPGTSWAQIVALLKSKTIFTPGDYYIALNKEGALIIAQKGPETSALNAEVQQHLEEIADGAKRVDYHFEDNAHSNVQASHSPISGISPDQMLIKKGTKWRHMVAITPGTGTFGPLLDIDQKDTTYAIMVCIFGAQMPPIQTITDDGITVPNPQDCLQ